MRLDHVAHPSRDPYATHRFYTEVMGFDLVQAYASRELLLVYSIPGGGSLAFSAARNAGTATMPQSAIRWETSHVGLTLRSREEFEHWLGRLKRLAVPHQVIDDERVYFSDPDGLVLEFEVESATSVNPAAPEILARWDPK